MIRAVGGGGVLAFLGRWLRRAAVTALVVFVTVLAVRAWEARRPPRLKPWHRFTPPSEARAGDLTERTTLEDYLAREQRVFDEVKSEIEDRLAPEDRTIGNRYYPESAASPRRFPRDWNRTFELVPAEIRGGVLLVHGLTDSPYSVRKLAELCRDRGLYALALRMPGHGSVPGGLVRVQWEDWSAAVRVGVRHVRRRIGEGKPLHLVGYSNGGALSVKYSLDALEDAALPRPDRVVLLSPMIGVSPAAGLAKFIGVLAVIPYFEKARWLDVLPEYNPYKYNSFPANAGEQSHRLTVAIQQQLARVAKAGKIGQLPPMLAFQSVVDATVLTDAVVWKLFDVLGENGSELVLFDLNRRANIQPFLNASDRGILERLVPPRSRRYTLTVITNAGADTPDVLERTVATGSEAPRDRPLGLAWPDQVFSLSHIAVPFATSDPLYGGEPEANPSGIIRLGVLAPRGERGVLIVSPGDFLRITWNPFFPYLEERVGRWVGGP
jgi:alpha-beta hydrolase superfamily lysophospholipase